MQSPQLLSDEEWETILDVAYQVCQLSFDNERDRLELLRLTKMLISSSAGTINEMSFVNGEATPLSISSLSDLKNLENFLTGGYFEEYPHGLYLKKGVFVYRDSDSIAGIPFRSSRMYKEVFQEEGIEYFVSTVLHDGAEPFGELSLYRFRDAEPFTEKDCTILRCLTPFFDLAVSNHGQPCTRQDLPDTITTRERDVIRLVLEGSSTQQIAEALCITPSTVKKHLNSIFAKTGVANRLELFKHFG